MGREGFGVPHNGLNPSTFHPEVHVSLGPIRKNRAVWIYLGYFGSSFYVGFVPNKIAWQYETKRLGVSEAYPAHPGCCTTLRQDNKLTALITIGEDQDTSNGVSLTSLILHECVHVFQRLCDHIGETKPSKEFEAYMIQHLYGDIAHAYARTRRDPFKIKFRA